MMSFSLMKFLRCDLSYELKLYIKMCHCRLDLFPVYRILSLIYVLIEINSCKLCSFIE